MKIVRIVAAVLLTLIMLYIARRTSRGHPEEFTGSDNGYTLQMTTVPKAPEQSRARLEVRLTGPLSPQMQPVLRYARSEQGQNLTNIADFSSVPLILADSTKGSYFVDLTTAARGGKIAYYFQVVDQSDALIASFLTVDGAPWILKYFGEVPSPVLIGHIGFIFATIFCVALAAMFSLSLIRGSHDVRPVALLLAIATVCAFIGGYPYGFAMNWYALGGIWEGVPFGTDATDNKTQLLLVYLLFAALASIGSLTRGKFGRDIFGSRALGWFGAGAFMVALLIYLIPHSIQFSPELTYTVCYSFIGFWVLVYLFGWITSRTKRISSRK